MASSGPLFRLAACPACAHWGYDRQGEECPTCHDTGHPGIVAVRVERRAVVLSEAELEAASDSE